MSNNTIVNDKVSTIIGKEVLSETVVLPTETSIVVAGQSGFLVPNSSSGNILVEVASSPTIIVTGLVGPIGRSEESMAYTKLVDFVSDSELYKGEAVPGALKSQAIWRIRKINIALDGDITEVWADGTDTFAKVWDDRASYSYGV